MRSLLLLSIVVVVAACSRSRPPEPNAKATTPPKDVCVVLSVGSEKGLAHIGVLAALREQGVPVSCIAGTSMGSLIGGLYAAAPEQDLVQQYKDLFDAYETRSRRDAGPLYVGALFGFNRQDWSRLGHVLDQRFAGRRIESLPIVFVTEHQQVVGDGIRSHVVRDGLLAEAVAASIANPMLFTDIRTEDGVVLDPGADRVSAVPLQAACETRPEMQFIVSNVSGREVQLTRTLDCPRQEIEMTPPDVNRDRAIRGLEPELTAIVSAGFREATERLDWGVLPTGVPPLVPLDFVEVVVELNVAPTKASGRSWDGTNREPDPELTVQVAACQGCDTYATSNGRIAVHQEKSTYQLHHNLGVVGLREGFSLNLSARDLDISAHDPIGQATVIYRGVNTVETAGVPQAEFRVSFRAL